MIINSIIDATGNTPVVRLHRVHTGQSGEIIVKLESFNPGGSVKDRAAFFIISEAERKGLLHPGGTIIESTSGNFGKSLAVIGAARGYRVILVVDPKTPPSVLRFVRAFGATLDLVDTPDETGGYQKRRIDRVKELLAQNPGAFWTNQYNNPDNPRAHIEWTAQEILRDVGEVDVLVAAVSTGGHISGLSKALKEKFPQLITVAVDAVGSSVFGFPFSRYNMRGIGLSWTPGNLAVDTIDYIHLVTDEEGIAASRILAKQEGLLIGESAGAAVFAALHYAHAQAGKRILVVAADGGVNYLDETFDDDWLARGGYHFEQWDNPGYLLEAARHPAYRPIALEDLCLTAD